MQLETVRRFRPERKPSARSGSAVIFLMDPASVTVRATGIRQRDAKQIYRCVRVFNCEHSHQLSGCTLVGGLENLSRQEALWKRGDRSRFSPWTMSLVC